MGMGPRNGGLRGSANGTKKQVNPKHFDSPRPSWQLVLVVAWNIGLLRRHAEPTAPRGTAGSWSQGGHKKIINNPETSIASRGRRS
jgi:hypothetical protein